MTIEIETETRLFNSYKQDKRDLKPGDQVNSMWNISTDIEHRGHFTFGRGGGVRVIDNKTIEVDYGNGDKHILTEHQINHLIADEIEFESGIPMIYEKTWRVSYRPDSDK